MNDLIVKGECSICKFKDRWLLHRVLVRGVDKQVCTSCVLKLHPSWFCPSCFEFFDHPPSTTTTSTHRFISCVKCSSSTHIKCLPSPPPSSFLCPPCSKPNFTFFPSPESPVDKNLATILLCASKVASASVARHLTVARARADRTVREAAGARKNAKEALEYCFALHKLKRLEGSLDVSGSRSLEMGTGNNHNVMCKKDDLNGFTTGGGQGKVKEVLNQNGLSVPVNKNGANGNPIIVKDNDGRLGNNGNPIIVKDNDGRLGNREQDLERVRSCHGRVVDVTSTS